MNHSWLHRLDRTSRNTLRWMTLRATLLVMIGFGPWLVGSMSTAQAVANLPLMFSISAMIAMVAAQLRKDRIGAATLNGWDEALAFNGVAALAHAIHRIMVA